MTPSVFRCFWGSACFFAYFQGFNQSKSSNSPLSSKSKISKDHHRAVSTAAGLSFVVHRVSEATLQLCGGMAELLWGASFRTFRDLPELHLWARESLFSLINPCYYIIIVIDLHMAMDQYLLIPFLGGWTSIYQLFWCSPGVQGFDTLPYIYHKA